MRETVRIGHVAKVKLPSEGNRIVDVRTVSDAEAGLRAFVVDDFLSEEECKSIRSAAPAFALAKSTVIRDFHILEELKNKKRLKKIFRDADIDKNRALDGKELATFLREETDLVDYNHTELIFYFVDSTDALQSSADSALSLKDFAKVDWQAYFAWISKKFPNRFARDSNQAWLEYTSPGLKKVLAKIATVTELPHTLVKQIKEPLQLLRYGPNGSHYSCHHDSAPDEVDDFRFLTFFLFLNDVQEGGETVLFGTDVNGTHPERASWGEVEWSRFENACLPTSSCPEDGKLRDPFSSAVEVKPKMGRALFWYNTEVDEHGRGKKFVWSSMHGGCPTKGQEKWAANVWLHAGPSMRDEDLEEL